MGGRRDKDNLYREGRVAEREEGRGRGRREREEEGSVWRDGGRVSMERWRKGQCGKMEEADDVCELMEHTKLRIM